MLYRLWPVLAVLFFAAVFLTGPAHSQDVTQADTMATQDVIEDQLKAFKSADHGRAFSHAANNIKQIFGTTERFISMVKRGYPAIYDSRSYSFGRNRLQDSTIFQEVFVVGQDGTQWQVIYTLVDQDGAWKITGVQVNPQTGTST